MELYIGEAVVIRGLSELPQPPPPTSHTIHLPLVARNAGAELPPVPSFQAVPFEGERYYRLGRAIVSWRVGSSAESVVYWLHGDHLGSLARVTDESGEQVLARGYGAWGEEVLVSGALTPTLPLGYTAQQFDVDTGLLYLHARWYHPGLARFISADTIVPEPGNPQDLNRYAYVRNNPLRYSDPSGHALWAGSDVAREFDNYVAPMGHWSASEQHVIVDRVSALVVDFAPGAGDVKGFAEVFTGKDLLTGESLGAWRWLGLLCISELRHVDEMSDLLRAVNGQ